jgi:glycosyltransferase involved in cell wall biosynthesis
MLFSPAAATRFADLFRRTGTLEAAWSAALRERMRIVHLPELDADMTPNLRVLQIVTSLHIGGAERVALDLAENLPSHGVDARLVILGKPQRETYTSPKGTLDLSEYRGDLSRISEELRGAALRFGADVFHAHLVRASEARAFSALGWPVILHIHNFPAGWPPDYATLSRGDVTLLAACSQKVEREVQRAIPEIPVRTIWNGVGNSANKRTTGGPRFTVVTLANPRRQKRLERIPEIARATAALLAPRSVRFVIAGAGVPTSQDAADALAALDASILQHNAAQWIERPGIITDPASLLAVADVMLSVSEFEGLSLAHLEALSAGVPLVASDAGGTGEIAEQSRSVRLLPVDASAEDFARAIVASAGEISELPPSFSRQKMVARSAWLAASATRRSARREKCGLWLIANNFSTGGAQSSARRLLVELQRRGVKVRAAVIQEQPQFPTPGRRALVDAGIPVFAATSVEDLLEAVESDPPATVFFWNLITSWKLQLADALLDTRIFDVSPGEMLFSSMVRFFKNPPAGFPYRTPSDYGARLSGMVVKYHAESARAAELGCPVHVIRNGIPSGEIPGLRDTGRLVLGTAARLSPDKKLEQLFKALQLAKNRLPPWVLQVAGGPERDFPDYGDKLKKLAKGLPVEWLGEIQEIDAFLGRLDIFVMISEPAGCPNATLEAAAASLPVIATDHGGAREQVVDGTTGRITPRGDAEAFANALAELANSPELRKTMGKNGRDYICREFSLKRMADAYEALIYG